MMEPRLWVEWLWNSSHLINYSTFYNSLWTLFFRQKVTFWMSDEIFRASASNEYQWGGELKSYTSKMAIYWRLSFQYFELALWRWSCDGYNFERNLLLVRVKVTLGVEKWNILRNFLNGLLKLMKTLTFSCMKKSIMTFDKMIIITYTTIF